MVKETFVKVIRTYMMIDDLLTCFRTMEALELVTFHKDGRVELKEDTLRKIFLSEAAKNRHVAVISVAGAFRSGKSFLLNFFIRYLRAKGASTWIGQQDEHLQGFKWNFGQNRVTTGICIWPEVFVIQNVAVVLLDTQGTFDQNTNMKENTAIVAISALLSSVQIFNYHERLDSQDLTNLEFFLEYGKLVQEHGGKSKNIKIFQDIVFLIRDWNFADENPFGFEGGRNYFENFVNPSVNKDGVTVNSDLVSVRQMLENCFDKVKCFLMPHPGDTVGGARDFKGQLKDIDEEFLVKLRLFVENLLAPGQVTPKQVAGRTVTGSQLLEHVRAYVDTFNNSKDLPEPKTMFNILAEEILRGLVKKARDLYLSMMDTQTQNVTDIQQLRQFHDTCSANALKCFDQGQKLGTVSQVNNSRSLLIEQITYEFHHFEERVQHRAQYASLQAQLSKQKRQNEKLKNDVYSLRTTIEEQQNKMEDQNMKINELREEIEDSDRNRKDQEERMSDLISNFQKLANANEEQKSQNEGLKRILNKNQVELERLKEQMKPKPQPSGGKKGGCTIL